LENPPIAREQLLWHLYNTTEPEQKPASKSLHFCNFGASYPPSAPTPDSGLLACHPLDMEI